MTTEDRSKLIVTGNSAPPTWSQGERLALWIGAGLAGGIALATLSSRNWSRLGSLLFGGSARILRSPVGPALLAAILARASAPASQTVKVELEAIPPTR